MSERYIDGWDAEAGTLDGLTEDEWRRFAWRNAKTALRVWAERSALVLGAVVLLLMF